MGREGMGAPAGEQPKELPKRDDDVSKWKMPDYYNAKKENDRRLQQAIQFIAENEKFKGNEKIAEILIKLLTAEEPKKEENKDSENNQPGGPGMGGPGMGGPRMGMEGPMMGRPGGMEQVARLDPQTIEAVVVALVANGSAPAKKALRDVVLGTLKTDDDTVATKFCLQALAADNSPENEDVLFQAFTEAERLRPADKTDNAQMPGARGFMGEGYGASGKLSADALRQMTLELIELSASENFRSKLAQYSLKAGQNMTAGAFTAISGLLVQSHPNNVASQLLLFQSDAPPPATKAKLASFFTEYSETALAHLLGVLKHKKPFNFASPANIMSRPLGTKESEKPKAGWGADPAAQDAARSYQERGMGMGLEGMNPRGMGMGMGRSGEKLDVKTLVAADAEMPARIAKNLWSPTVAQVVGAKLAQAGSLEEAGVVIPLARTMPVDDVRARLFRLMQAHWEEGSRWFLAGVLVPDGGGMGGRGMAPGQSQQDYLGLQTAGQGGMGAMGGGLEAGRMGMPGGGMDMGMGEFAKPLCDPGFLLLVKMLPIDEKRAGARVYGNGAAAQRPGAMGEDMPGAGMAGQGSGGSPVFDWQTVHANLFRHLADAFQAAARSNRDAQPVGTLPIELHNDKDVEVRYDLKWPESAPKNSGQALDPLEVHYIRIAETADPSKVWKTYSRILKTKGRMLQQGNVALLDAVKEGSAPGRKLSIDVAIIRQQPGMAAAPQPATDRRGKKAVGEPLVVEILTVEMKDPSGTAAAATSAPADKKADAAAPDEDAEKAARLKELREKAAAEKLKR